MSVVLFSSNVRGETGGRLLATGGVSTIEGAGGGGLVPWALTGTYATGAEMDVAVAVTGVNLRDYDLTHASVMFNWHDRLELTFAKNRFDLGTLSSVVNYDDLNMNVVGLKWRIVGDAVYDADRWLPQLALGIEYKELNVDDFDALVNAVNLPIEKRFGTDFYLSASKVFFAGLLGRNVVANATLRSTTANQFGLLGFGSTQNDDRQWMTEISLAVLLTDSLAVGAEYRDKPDNLADAGLKEESASDIFMAWFINKHVSLTLARVDLGNIALYDKQTGSYASLQWIF